MAATDPRPNERPAEWFPAAVEPFSVADLRSLEEALEQLIEREASDWPTRERHDYLERLEHLRYEVQRRLR